MKPRFSVTCPTPTVPSQVVRYWISKVPMMAPSSSERPPTITQMTTIAA